MIGMARPKKKKKLEAVEPTVEDGAEAEDGTGAAGVEQPALDGL